MMYPRRKLSPLGRSMHLLVVGLAIALVIPSMAFAQDAPPPAAEPAPVAAPAAAPADGPPALPSVQDVVDHFDDLYRADSSHGTLTMDIVTAHWSRTLEMEMWSKGDDLGLVVIRSPSKEAGTATLRTDEGLWNYAPRADRLMRVPSGMLSDGWMGSHFSNDDVMRESSWVDDYDTTLKWVDEDGARYLLMVAIPKEDAAVVYTKVEHRMTEEGWLPVRSDYFDGDELVRTMRFKDIKELGGRTIPSVMELIPMDAPEEVTRLTYSEMKFGVKLKDSLFTSRGLRKAAQR